MKDKYLIIDTNIVYYWYQHCMGKEVEHKFDIEKLVKELDAYAECFCLAVNQVTVHEIINHFRNTPDEAKNLISFLDEKNVWATSSVATDGYLTNLPWEDYIEIIDENISQLVQEKINFETHRFFEYKLYLIHYVLMIVFEGQSKENSKAILRNLNTLDSVFNDSHANEIFEGFTSSYLGENEATDVEELFKKMVKSEFEFIFGYIGYSGIEDDDLDKYFISIRNDTNRILSKKIANLAKRDEKYDKKYQSIAGKTAVYVDVFTGYQKLSEGYNDYLRYRLGKIFKERANFYKNDIGDICIFSELDKGSLILTNDKNMRQFLKNDLKYKENSNYIEDMLGDKE